MSLALIDKLHLQARKTSEEDVGKICSSLTALFGVPEKSSEATALMRQLFFILQAKETSTWLPSGLIFNLINAVMVRDRGRIKECLLCERILQEVFPLDKKFDPELAKLNEKIPSPIHLWMCQDIESLSKLFAKAVRWLKAQDLEWEAERKLFTFLVGVALIHPDLLSADRVRSVHERVGSWLLGAGLYQAPNPYSSNPFRKDQNNPVTEVDGSPSNNIFTVLSIGQYYTDDQLVNIFSFSMLYQWISNSYHGLLINNSYPMEPGDDASDLEKDDELDLYRSQPQRIRSSSRSSHVSKNSDGTASPTSVASVEKTPVTKTWSADLSKSSRPRTPVRKAQSLVTEGDGDRFSSSVTSTASERLTTEFKNSSPSDTVWLTESGETSERPVSTQTTLSLSEVPRSPNPKAAMDTEEVKREMTKHVFEPLIGRTIDYCFRLLDQCDRKPKNQSDVELLNACQLETVKLLEFVCRIDGAQIPRVFRELKRLMANCTQDDRNPKLLIAILQFLENHSKAVAYDCQQELNKLFHGVLSRNFDQTAVSFDIVMFVLDNLEKLTHQYHVMAIYFPNIFKILAWNPHTFISDFQDILPAMMSSVTSLEVFHTLVDLPCMTVALEVIERTKHLDFTSLQPVTDEQPTRALDAFKNAMFRPMFNFFTRSEGGHGDTIDRLDQFHTSIQDMVDLPRVLVCYQSAALLLRTWFSVILEEVDQDFVSRLLPVLMERTGLVYGILEYKSDMRRIIAENTVRLLKKFPQTVVQQRDEIAEFLSQTRNITGREAFFCQLVWGVGEYLSNAYSPACTAEVIGHMYETLELLTYEVIAITGSTRASQAPFSVQVVSTLMSALAKLSSRCQDLIPRAILCLTKVSKQHSNDIVDPIDQEILLNKAHELINLLKIPNFASVILNPSPSLETDRVHEDGASLASILRTTHRLAAPSV